MESKLRPPPSRGRSVSRARLVDGLEAARATPIVALSAGPGWGKTTLLAQWASRSSRPFAWISVDDRDNDPIVLLSYVAAAVDRVSRLDPGVFEALALPGVSVEATVVPRLGAALASLGREVVLVLDDVDVIDDPACLDAIATLARHLQDGSQVVLSSRGESEIPLGAARARGLAMDVGPDELRLSATGARQLLRAAGVKLADEQIAELTTQTEGWPAGLHFAALSIRARRGTATATFSGSDGRIADYLKTELLAHLAAPELHFLTRTAVLERLTGPLCDAVLQQHDSTAMLESLAHSNLFLVPLDASGESYRYHHLFGELLRSELTRIEPELESTLLRRATDWYEAHEQPEDAIVYAQSAGDVDRVARLVERCALPAYHSGRVATAERWLVWLESRGALERHATLAVFGGLLATVWGRPAEADRLTEIAERASHDGRLPDGSASIESWRALLRAQRCRRGVATMHADAQLAVRTLARGSPHRPNAMVLLAISQLLAGEVDQADDLLADVVEEGFELHAPETAALALGERAAIAIQRGAWVNAEELADQALRLIRRSRMDAYPTSAFLYALAARVALHRGEASRARALLARTQLLRPRLTYAIPYLAVQTRLELAHAYLTLADAAGAETMRREIEALLRRQPELGVLETQAEQLRASLKTMRAEAPGTSTLTTAELRVLPYLATHLSFRGIGERLFVSRHTVKSHAMAIYRKLNVSSRGQAVQRARQLGLR